ncbi:Uncharacterised protein [Streptobacillus moniliformis]|nr:Uncharacterised protein [Streptobacillus moniliformis]
MDIEENKSRRIYDFLSSENIKLNASARNIDEALKIAVNLMVENQIVERNTIII